MRKTFMVVVAAALLAASASTALAQEMKTIKGEVVDLSCYAAGGAKGADHKTCAIACLQAGEPAGILEEGTGKVYLVITTDHTNPATRVLPYVAKTVEVTGAVFEKNGVAAIEIKDIKG